ncbi:hypothetical protein EJ03DRAFT_52103 [Teratosphaeria nubilosa]|uniref:Uncharacterized protein n=1 Tax=Teratosphaeria nubilosa TaxID=161662 RepID=A0A6G1LEZ3_9PEZI|nr:hypothetical protein EJ03DRAFT_52103 [Teratosphaeria nubilosa]
MERQCHYCSLRYVDLLNSASSANYASSIGCQRLSYGAPSMEVSKASLLLAMTGLNVFVGVFEPELAGNRLLDIDRARVNNGHRRKAAVSIRSATVHIQSSHACRCDRKHEIILSHTCLDIRAPFPGDQSVRAAGHFCDESQHAACTSKFLATPRSTLSAARYALMYSSQDRLWSMPLIFAHGDRAAATRSPLRIIIATEDI